MPSNWRGRLPGFTVLAEPYFFQAGQSSTSFALPLLMFIATAPPRPDDDLGLILIKLTLNNSHCFDKVLVGEFPIIDGMAVLGQEGRFHAAGNGLPAVEVENFHGLKSTRHSLECSDPSNTPFPYLSGAGRLVIKDAIMMGAALVTMAD
jgi:hypothetical protein